MNKQIFIHTLKHVTQSPCKAQVYASSYVLREFESILHTKIAQIFSVKICKTMEFTGVRYLACDCESISFALYILFVFQIHILQTKNIAAKYKQPMPHVWRCALYEIAGISPQNTRELAKFHLPSKCSLWKLLTPFGCCASSCPCCWCCKSCHLTLRAFATNERKGSRRETLEESTSQLLCDWLSDWVATSGWSLMYRCSGYRWLFGYLFGGWPRLRGRWLTICFQLLII